MLRLFLSLTIALSLSACIADDGGDTGALTVQELEDVLEDARTCTAEDQCIVVDTYCCPRPINASARAAVEDAHERLIPEGTECLADCISAADLEANCVEGQCSLLPF